MPAPPPARMSEQRFKKCSADKMPGFTMSLNIHAGQVGSAGRQEESVALHALATAM